MTQISSSLAASTAARVRSNFQRSADRLLEIISDEASTLLIDDGADILRGDRPAYNLGDGGYWRSPFRVCE